MICNVTNERYQNVSFKIFQTFSIHFLEIEVFPTSRDANGVANFLG